MGDDLEERIDPVGKRLAIGTGLVIGGAGVVAFIASYHVPDYRHELVITSLASIPVAAVASNVAYRVYVRFRRKD